MCLCIYEIRECGGAEPAPHVARAPLAEAALELGPVHLIKIPFHEDKRVSAPHFPYRCSSLVLIKFQDAPRKCRYPGYSL